MLCRTWYPWWVVLLAWAAVVAMLVDVAVSVMLAFRQLTT